MHGSAKCQRVPGVSRVAPAVQASTRRRHGTVCNSAVQEVLCDIALSSGVTAAQVTVTVVVLKSLRIKKVYCH